MTNALAQSNISENSVINMVSNINLNVNSTDNIDTSSSNEFSNLMNNATAKTEATKTNFIDKAVKSNTSSVNQKAIQNGSNGATSSKLAKESVKQAAKNALQNPKQTQQSTKNTPKNTDNTTQNSINTNNKPQAQNNTTKADTTATTATVNSAQSDTTAKSNLSDINNSSLVEPSPVFSSDNEAIDSAVSEDTNVEAKDELISIAGIISTSITNTTDDKVDFDELEESVDDISTVEEVKEILNDIVSKLEDTQLNQDFKNEINDILNKIDLNSPNLSEIKNDFKNLISSLNEKISTATDDNQNTIDFAQKISDVILDKLTEIKSDVFDNNLNDIDISKLKQDIKTLSEDIKDLLSSIKNSKNLDDIKNSSIKDVLDIISEKTDNLIDIISGSIHSTTETTSDDDTIKLDDINANDIAKAADDIISNLKALKEDISIADDDNSIDLTKTITTLAQTINELKNANLSSQNKEDLAKISDILKDYSKNTDNKTSDNEEVLSKDEVSTLKQILEKTASLVEKSPLDIAQKDELISKINTSVEEFSQVEVDNFDNQNSKAEIKLEDDTNEINLADELNSSATLDDNFNSDNTFDNNSSDSSKAKVSTKTPIKEEDVQKVEENLEKLASIDEILDDMLSDDVPLFESDTASLSVADEVTKIALNETNSLSQNTIQGSVVYDPSSNGGILMKNIAQKAPVSTNFQEHLTSKLENSQVLNQITNKITQNTDGSQKLTLVLRPNDLGRLSIELNNNEKGLTTNILAQNEDVRNYIEKNINALRQQLSDAGINVNNIQIKTMGQENSTSYDGNQNFNGQENSENFNNQQNERQQKENNERYFANNFGYEFGTTKDFSGVFKNILNYNLN